MGSIVRANLHEYAKIACRIAVASPTHRAPVAVTGEPHFVPMLPKTRSGKIMRRVLKAVVLERDPGDITTIEDESSVEEARRATMDLKEGIL